MGAPIFAQNNVSSVKENLCRINTVKFSDITSSFAKCQAGSIEDSAHAEARQKRLAGEIKNNYPAKKFSKQSNLPAPAENITLSFRRPKPCVIIADNF
ncbi:MAG: hypothetical protein H6695_09020 [Deferribacteres bacterium]|nr:hypothetical protein [candidate division KSB1 bacterium]MCB9510311.1 hypothetical protein [Deferribacteres bacterium]